AALAGVLPHFFFPGLHDSQFFFHRRVNIKLAPFKLVRSHFHAHHQRILVVRLVAEAIFQNHALSVLFRNENFLDGDHYSTSPLPPPPPPRLPPPPPLLPPPPPVDTVCIFPEKIRSSTRLLVYCVAMRNACRPWLAE